MLHETKKFWCDPDPTYAFVTVEIETGSRAVIMSPTVFVDYILLAAVTHLMLFFPVALKVYREVKDALKEKQLEAEDDHSDCSG